MQSSSSGLLEEIRAHRFSTRSVDAAAAHLFEHYGHDVRWEGGTQSPDFRVRIDSFNMNGVTLMKTEAASYSVARRLVDCIQISILSRGALRLTGPGTDETVSASRQFAAVTRPYDVYTHTLPTGAGVSVLLNVKKLLEQASFLQMRHLDETQLSEIQPRLDLTKPVVAAFVRNAKSVLSEVQALQQDGIKLLPKHGFEHLILNLAAAALFPGVSDVILKTAAVTRSITRDVANHLEENASQVLSIAGVAAQFGMSMRALQENFQRHYGCSPREFLTERRLKRARSLLLTGQLGDTVSRIAVSSGFTDLTMFARKYREVYGELPSETLRRAQN